MKPYRDSNITLIALSIFFVVLGGYAFFEARGILMGPQIEIPEPVVYVHEPSVAIAGTTKHIAALSMNGTPVPVTEAGAFNEVYIASEGYNRVVLQATDKYGHIQERTIEVVYTPTTLSSDQPSIHSIALASDHRRATTTPTVSPSQTTPEDTSDELPPHENTSLSPTNSQATSTTETTLTASPQEPTQLP